VGAVPEFMDFFQPTRNVRASYISAAAMFLYVDCSHRQNLRRGTEAQDDLGAFMQNPAQHFVRFP
jgi:hypothetical protein